jgi:putative transposase
VPSCARSSTPSSSLHSLRSGCAWRLLPHDFPPWKSVHHYFRTWHIDGTRERGCTLPWVRAGARSRRMGREILSQAPAIVDSQSVKSTAAWEEESSAWIPTRWQEGEGQKSAICSWIRRSWYSRSRCTLCVPASSWTSRGSRCCPNRRGPGVPPSLKHLWLDSAYRGENEGKDWVQKVLGWSVELVERPKKPAPKEVLKAWAQEWAKEGIKIDREKLPASS